MAIKKISELPIATFEAASEGYVPVSIADDTKRVRVGDIGGSTAWADIEGKLLFLLWCRKLLKILDINNKAY